MTRDEAIAIRAKQLQGAVVEPGILQEAIDTIKATNVALTDADIQKIRYHAGDEPKREPKVRVVVVAKRDCPCGDGGCEADPLHVASVLKPWTLLKPGENDPPAPEETRWPRPQEVDMDAVYRTRGVEPS